MNGQPVSQEAYNAGVVIGSVFRRIKIAHAQARERERGEFIVRYNSLASDFNYGNSLVQASRTRGDTAATRQLTDDQRGMAQQLDAMRDTAARLGLSAPAPGALPLSSAPAASDLIHDSSGDSARLSHGPIRYVALDGRLQPVFSIVVYQLNGVTAGLLVLDCHTMRAAGLPQGSSLSETDLATATWNPVVGEADFQRAAARVCSADNS